MGTERFIPLESIKVRMPVATEGLRNIQLQSHRISRDVVEPIKLREHMARPYPQSEFDFLAIDVPSTYQQGFIPDGEEPPWGMLRVVATARETHSVNAGILDAHRLKLLPDEIKEQIIITKAKVVGLNPTSVNVFEAQLIADICDEIGVPYILGGIHATLNPKTALEDFPTAKAIVRGNGEVVIGDLITKILKGGQTMHKGVYHSGTDYDKWDDYAEKLDPGSVPLVNQLDLIEEPIYKHTITLAGADTEISEATLFVTEGCPFDCSFCASPIMVNRSGKNSKPYSRPSMSRIIEEISHCVNDLDADAIHFLDDMAFIQESHIEELHSGLVESGLIGKFIWRGLTRAPVIEKFDDTTMRLMKESGAWKIALGIESGSEEILKIIKKRVTTDQVRTAIKKLASYGIQSKGFFIMGFPGETEEQIMQTRNLLRELKQEGLTEAAIFQFKPYPGTEDFRRLEEAHPN